jgi:YVTN family beta-propeller protein
MLAVPLAAAGLTAAPAAAAATYTVTATIPVGGSPEAVGVNPATNTVYVANSGGGSVSVIDGATNTVTHTITVGTSPSAVGVDPATNTVYVTNNGGSSVSVIDGATRTVTATIGVGVGPVGVGVDPATHAVYVANVNDNSVSVITPVITPACPSGTKANFRWHYTASGNAGGWSGTATQACPGSITMGPQAMDGNLQVAPGATLQAGYDFTLPGNTTSLTMTVSAAQVTFAVACVSGATPSAGTLTVPLPAQTYQITNDQWYPSGDQSSPLVYQGSVTVPNLCGGGTISLAKGGTFTATLS